MTGFCKTHVPADVEAALESIKDNDEAVKNFGIDLGTRMCRRILDSGCPGLHMYTLNTERSSVAILENLGLINKSQVYACLVSSERAWLDCIGGLPVLAACLHWRLACGHLLPPGLSKHHVEGTTSTASTCDRCAFVD